MALVLVALIVPSIYNVYAIAIPIRADGIITSADRIITSADGVITSADARNVNINIEICLDGVDNNRNGEKDEEPCTEPNTRFEYCNNNADDDLDGKTDEPEDCIIVELCNNGEDDDMDGKVDEQRCVIIIIIDIRDRDRDSGAVVVDLTDSQADTTDATNEVFADFLVEDSQADQTSSFNILEPCATAKPSASADISGLPQFLPTFQRAIISGTASLDELREKLEGNQQFTLELRADFSNTASPFVTGRLIPASLTESAVEFDDVNILNGCNYATAANTNENGEIKPTPDTSGMADAAGQQDTLEIFADRIGTQADVQSSINAFSLGPLTRACASADQTGVYRFVGTAPLSTLGDIDNTQDVSFNFVSDLSRTDALKISGAGDNRIAGEIAVDKGTSEAQVITFNILEVLTECTSGDDLLE